MDGLTFLKKLMRQHPLPVVLCTTQAERAVTALEMGARGDRQARLDQCGPAGGVVAEPAGERPQRRAGRASAFARGPALGTPIAAIRPTPSCRGIPYSRHAGISERIIVVGISTGGVQALHQLLPGFSAASPGIVIVQHMPPEFIPAFAQRLDKDPEIKLEVAEARHHEPVRPGRALVIPGDKHGLIRRTGAGFRIELVEGPPVCRHRPSVEVLFRSAAQAAGPFAAGVIMTGMGDDGAVGLLEMRDAGA